MSPQPTLNELPSYRLRIDSDSRLVEQLRSSPDKKNSASLRFSKIFGLIWNCFGLFGLNFLSVSVRAPLRPFVQRCGPQNNLKSLPRKPHDFGLFAPVCALQRKFSKTANRDAGGRNTTTNNNQQSTDTLTTILSPLSVILSYYH